MDAFARARIVNAENRFENVLLQERHIEFSAGSFSGRSQFSVKETSVNHLPLQIKAEFMPARRVRLTGVGDGKDAVKNFQQLLRGPAVQILSTRL